MGTPARRNTRPLKEQPSLEQSANQSWIQRLATGRGMLLLGGISVLLLLLAAAGGWYVLRQRTGSPLAADITPPASISELATQYPELASILQDPELDSAYKDFLLAYQEKGPQAALDLARQRGLVNDKDELRITLELDTEDTTELIAQLEGRGIKVTAASGNLIDVAVPINMIEQAMQSGDPSRLFRDLAGLEHITRIRLPRHSIQDAGFQSLPAPKLARRAEIESLSVINATAWHDAGFTGQGIKIGILDMGFNKYKSFLGSELPEHVTVQSFIAGSEIDDTDTEHGAACAEVIHDIAPDAELFFAAYDTDVEQRQAVDWLVSQGVQVISHSAGSIYGPMDGSGPEAQMVDQVVAGGIVWVNSSGNMGDAHYRGTFNDQDGDGFHEFEPNDEMLEFEPKENIVITLNWDAWGTGDQDYDVLVLDRNKNTIVSSENTQDGDGDDAAEILSFLFFDSGPYYVAFYAANITRPGVLDFYIYNASIEYITPEYSLVTPSDALSSLTVGATYWEDDQLEDYSSQGPTNDERLKPDISAPTGIQSVVYEDAFFGTSSSAPHVAAAAALVRQAFPDFSVQQIKDYLINQSVDLGDTGPDNRFGYGRLWLGDPPEMGVPPGVIPTEIVLAPPATPEILETATRAPTRTPKKTATPKTPKTPRSPTATPRPEDSDSDNTAFSLGLAFCVIVPGLLGLGGIGLLGGVWYWSRSRGSRPVRPARRAPVAHRPMGGTPATPLAGRKLEPREGSSYPPAYQAAPAAQNQCPLCGSPHAPGARFCTKCGKALQPGAPAQMAAPAPAAYCVNCGQPLRPNSKFCAKCGRPR